MSDRQGQPGIGDASIDANAARWLADPALAPLFASRGGPLLVLDAAAACIVGVLGQGEDLRMALAGEDGRIRSGLRVFEQLRQLAGSSGSSPRLVRLRLDTRGIARPTACLVARANTEAGDAVLLVAPNEPLPMRRQTPSRAEPVRDVGPPSEPEARVPVLQTGRFVWRSDEKGVVSQIAGGPAETIAFLAGHAWQELHDSRVAAGDNFFEALAAQRTFRTLALILRPPGERREVDVDLSGAPTARAGQPFGGFSGFGVVRQSRVILDDRGETPNAERSNDPSEAQPFIAQAEAQPATVADMGPDEAASVLSDQAASLASHQALPIAAANEGDSERPPGEDGAPVAQAPDLSTNEHDAFREIARALGARFAGDEQAPPAEMIERPAGHGAVMVFPGSAPPHSSAAIDAAIVAALDRLPAGVFVHRDAEVLYVNRRFLDLTGYEHREGLVAAGGFSHLLGRLPPPQDRITADTPVTITTGAGEELPLLVERSKVDWDGGPAELLLVRAAAQADQTRAQITKGLLETREPTRERLVQELLDQVGEGVATVDEAGRVLTLNASAQSLLSSDAHGSGAALSELFAPESLPALADGLRRARETGTGTVDRAFPLAGERMDALHVRIHRLSATEPARFCATLRSREARGDPNAGSRAAAWPDLIERINEEMRAPIKRMLDRTELLLSEQDGAFANRRGGEYLREIHEAASRLLGVTDDLRDLFRIEGGRADLAFRDLGLNEIVSDCIAQVQPDAVRGRIVVRTSLSQDLAPVFADERSMRQATHNVIANAIRLTEAGGQVIISTAVERGGIAFRVRDTGAGMSQDEIERALTRHVSGDHAGDGGNPGLGLLLTKALVEANRGRFRITSRKDEGTLVEMLFPSRQALSA